MSSYLDDEEEKKPRIGNAFRAINNQQLLERKIKEKNICKKDESNFVIIKQLMADSDIQQAFKEIDIICKERKIITHGKEHAEYVSKVSGEIIKGMGMASRIVNLAQIAGYLHDLGYRLDAGRHSFIGAGMGYEKLRGFGMPQDEINRICSAIAYHHNSKPVNEICAALIIAEASDFSKRRIQTDVSSDELALLMSRCSHNELTIIKKEKIIRLRFKISFSNTASKDDFVRLNTIKHSFCKKAAEFFGFEYEVVVNNEIIF